MHIHNFVHRYLIFSQLKAFRRVPFLLLSAAVCSLLNVSCSHQDAKDQSSKGPVVPRLVFNNGSIGLTFERFQSTYEKNLKPENWFNDEKTLELCRAIIDQDVEKMQAAIDSGADVNAKGVNDMPLLLWAMPAGTDGLERLLSAGADPNVVAKIHYFGPDKVQNAGDSLLYTAIMISGFTHDEKFKDYAATFLKHGADPNLGKRSTLIAAILYAQNKDLVRILLEAGADPNRQDGIDDSPLSLAWMNCPEQVLSLLEHGAVYDVATPSGSFLQVSIFDALHSKKSEPLLPSEKERQEIAKKTASWLEERGVSFDAPVELVRERDLIEQARLARQNEGREKLGAIQVAFNTAMEERDLETLRVKYDEKLAVIKEYADSLDAIFFNGFANRIDDDASYIANHIDEDLALNFIELAIPVFEEAAPGVKSVRIGVSDERFESAQDAVTTLKLRERRLEMKKMVDAGDENAIRQSVDELVRLAASDKVVLSSLSTFVTYLIKNYPQYALKLVDADLQGNRDKPANSKQITNLKAWKKALEERLADNPS